MEMNAAKKVQYRHKLTGEDVRIWQRDTSGRGVFVAVLLALAACVMMLVNAPWQ